MTVWLTALSAAAAVICAVGPSSGARLLRISAGWRGPEVAGRRRSADSAASGRRPGLLRALACALGAAGTALLVEGVGGAVVGLLVGAGAWLLTGRLEPLELRRRRAAVQATLPLATDLFAACLSAGRPATASLQVVARSVGGPLEQDLALVAARLGLGGDPVEVWRAVPRADPLAPLARVMARSLETGAPAAAGLARLADDLRRERRADVDRAARSVGVHATAPLGLCFLPAFLLIGVVPAVVGILTAVELW